MEIHNSILTYLIFLNERNHITCAEVRKSFTHKCVCTYTHKYIKKYIFICIFYVNPYISSYLSPPAGGISLKVNVNVGELPDRF